uniref:Uncharacterized protein n=1 Tax=Chlamydia pneumoniae TaxID=83558 RepID=A0A0F7WVW8_CHLPN|nr:hypothetical protein BN1224_DC9_BQ_00030 [Chlamydia pneumoniae]
MRLLRLNSLKLMKLKRIYKNLYYQRKRFFVKNNKLRYNLSTIFL